MNNDDYKAKVLAAWGREVLNLRENNGVYFGLMPFIFTWGVAVNLRPNGTYDGRFCFSSLQEALAFFESWDFKTRPVVGVDGCTADKCTADLNNIFNVRIKQA